LSVFVGNATVNSIADKVLSKQHQHAIASH